MVFKLLKEEGKYRDIPTGEPRNMLQANIAWTPEGVNVGWDDFETVEEAMRYYNIELIPDEQNHENDI
jgi:hypothetical protein